MEARVHHGIKKQKNNCDWEEKSGILNINQLQEESQNCEIKCLNYLFILFCGGNKTQMARLNSEKVAITIFTFLFLFIIYILYIYIYIYIYIIYIYIYIYILFFYSVALKGIHRIVSVYYLLHLCLTNNKYHNNQFVYLSSMNPVCFSLIHFN